MDIRKTNLLSFVKAVCKLLVKWHSSLLFPIFADPFFTRKQGYPYEGFFVYNQFVSSLY